jgi:hypothetical protein
MKAWIAVLVLVCTASTVAHGRGPASREVTAWNTFTANLVAENLPPGPQTYTLAIVHIAIHDALNAIDPRYERYEFGGSAPGASVVAAVAASAHDTLAQLVPQAAAAVDAQYTTALSTVPDGAAKDMGIAIGQAAAAAILARRSSDNLPAAITKPYVPGPANPGIYQPTPPLNVVILAGWSELPPFALERASQFRPPAPPSIGSVHYAKDFNEVRRKGSRDSTRRTAEQTEIAQFWFTAATREWNVAAQKGLADTRADEWRAARTLALMNIALADAVIATFDAKFQFNYWRPITAIRAADTDGNAATNGDPAWEPLCDTPPFPEYNSTHAATATAAAGVLALELGDRHSFTVTTPSGVSRGYDRFSAAAYEEGISRIYCGIHFRTAMKMGFRQGSRVATYVHKNLLRPVSD